MADRKDIEPWLLDFLRKRSPEGATPAADTDLFESGYLDSLGMILLISAIGNRFGIALSPDELSEDSFRTVNAVIGLIEREAA